MASITRCRASLLADFRFGFFRYNVAVLPFDYGTTPAADAGIPSLNLDSTFTSGLPAGFIEGSRGAFNFGSGLGVNRCNCPLDQDEKQMQLVGNVTKMLGSHTFKFGADVRRAYNLRVPSDRHRSGELTFSGNRTAGPTGGGLGLATFLLGDVTRFTRYVSPSTDARERQWRQFYYAQDTWRPHAKLTVNYGLRLDVIHPQTVNEPGNGGWLDLDTGEILVGGVGGIGLDGDVRNRLNWAPRLGVDLPGGRTHGPARRIRAKLRHRCLRLALRPQRDAEPARALGAGTQRSVELRLRVHPGAGTAGPRLPRGAGEWALRAAQRCVQPRFTRAAAAAGTRRLQRHASATAHEQHVGRSGLCRQSRAAGVRR